MRCHVIERLMDSSDITTLSRRGLFDEEEMNTINKPTNDGSNGSLLQLSTQEHGSVWADEPEIIVAVKDDFKRKYHGLHGAIHGIGTNCNLKTVLLTVYSTMAAMTT